MNIINKNVLILVIVFYASLGTSFVTIWALFLPKVENSLYFHRNKQLTNHHNSESINDFIESNIPDNVFVSYNIKYISNNLL